MGPERRVETDRGTAVVIAKVAIHNAMHGWLGVRALPAIVASPLSVAEREVREIGGVEHRLRDTCCHRCHNEYKTKGAIYKF